MALSVNLILQHILAADLSLHPLTYITCIESFTRIALVYTGIEWCLLVFYR